MPPWFNSETIARLVQTRDLANHFDHALRHGLRAKALVPQRSVLFTQDKRAAFLSMPALLEHNGLFISKVASFVERPPTAEIPTIHAIAAAFSSKTGIPLGIFEAAAITREKCAAITAMVTAYCAHPNSRVLGILGGGIQAVEQVRGILSVCAIDRIKVYVRTPKHADRFLNSIAPLLSDKVRVSVENAPEQVIRGADIVSTATSLPKPLCSFWPLEPHAHINCMGAHTTLEREVPNDLLEKSLLFVEDLGTAVAEAGRTHCHAMELEKLHLQSEQIKETLTIFGSTGHAFYDLLTIEHVLINDANASHG